MKIRNGVDLNRAFQSLKETLQECETELKAKEHEPDSGKRYAGMYGKLSGAVSYMLVWNTEDTTFEDFKAKETVSDIPIGLFEKPGNADLENTLN